MADTAMLFTELERLYQRRWGDDVWAKVQQGLADADMTEDNWSPQEINDIARMVADGMDVGDAFERAAIIHHDETADDLAGLDPDIDAVRTAPMDVFEALASEGGL